MATARRKKKREKRKGIQPDEQGLFAGYSFDQLLGLDPVDGVDLRPSATGRIFGAPFRLVGALIKLPFRLLGGLLRLPARAVGRGARSTS